MASREIVDLDVIVKGKVREKGQVALPPVKAAYPIEPDEIRGIVETSIETIRAILGATAFGRVHVDVTIRPRDTYSE